MSEAILEPVMPRPKHVDGKTVRVSLDCFERRMVYQSVRSHFEAKKGDVAKEILKVMTLRRALDMELVEQFEDSLIADQKSGQKVTLATRRGIGTALDVASLYVVFPIALHTFVTDCLKTMRWSADAAEGVWTLYPKFNLTDVDTSCEFPKECFEE